MTVNDSEKLAEAAGVLIKLITTASSQVDSGNEAVEALKKLSIQASSVENLLGSWKESQEANANAVLHSMANFEGKLATFEEQFVTLNRSIAAQSKNLDLNFDQVDVKLSTLNKYIAAQAKNQTLEWAISNASLYSFRYYEKPTNGCGCGDEAQSTELVRHILFAFRKNYGGFPVGKSSLTHYCRQSEETIAKGEEEFREALRNQIHMLTGRKPRIVEIDSSWLIYYC